MTIKTNTQMFAAPDDSQAESEAKQYIKSMSLTAKDVRIVRCGGQIIVQAIRDFE